MKKLLGVCTLLLLFVLSACGGSSSGVIVCTDEDGHIISAYHEDGEITSFVIKQTEDVTDMDEEQVAFFTAMADAMPEAEYSIDDNILTFIMTLEGEAIQEMIPINSLGLDAFIAQSEETGSTCE